MTDCYPKSGKYAIKEMVGRGGSFVVYEATDPEGKSVALKVLRQTRFASSEWVKRVRR